jgi:hypothetical protein
MVMERYLRALDEYLNQDVRRMRFGGGFGGSASDFDDSYNESMGYGGGRDSDSDDDPFAEIEAQEAAIDKAIAETGGYAIGADGNVYGRGTVGYESLSESQSAAEKERQDAERALETYYETVLEKPLDPGGEQYWTGRYDTLRAGGYNIEQAYDQVAAEINAAVRAEQGQPEYLSDLTDEQLQAAAETYASPETTISQEIAEDIIAEQERRASQLSLSEIAASGSGPATDASGDPSDTSTVDFSSVDASGDPSDTSTFGATIYDPALADPDAQQARAQAAALAAAQAVGSLTPSQMEQMIAQNMAPGGRGGSYSTRPGATPGTSVVSLGGIDYSFDNTVSPDQRTYTPVDANASGDPSDTSTVNFSGGRTNLENYSERFPTLSEDQVKDILESQGVDPYGTDFSNVSGDPETSTTEYGTTLGGSAGDFEGVDFGTQSDTEDADIIIETGKPDDTFSESDDSDEETVIDVRYKDEEPYGTTLGGSAGDFEGVDFGTQSDTEDEEDTTDFPPYEEEVTSDDTATDDRGDEDKTVTEEDEETVTDPYDFGDPIVYDPGLDDFTYRQPAITSPFDFAGMYGSYTLSPEIEQRFSDLTESRTLAGLEPASLYEPDYLEMISAMTPERQAEEGIASLIGSRFPGSFGAYPFTSTPEESARALIDAMNARNAEQS